MIIPYSEYPYGSMTIFRWASRRGHRAYPRVREPTNMELDPSSAIMRQLVETHRSDLQALGRLYTISIS
jgi:hypothetical protein